MSNTNDSAIYYENWLMRKEAVNTWVEYWVVVRRRWLQFYLKKGNDRAELAKTLELTKFVQCSLIERSNHRFHFSIDNGYGKYYVKCNTELERYHWIFSILSSAKEQPIKPLPEQIPSSMTEEDAFKKSHKTFQKHPPFGNPLENKNKNKEPSKHRQKYAKRREDLAKKKREKKLAGVINNQQLRPSSAMGVRHTGISSRINLRASSAMGSYEKHGDELHRTRRIINNEDDLSIDKLSLNDHLEINKLSKGISAIETQKTLANESRQTSGRESQKKYVNESLHISALELQRNLCLFSENKQSEGELKVPTSLGVGSLKTQNKKVPPINVMDNYAFQHEDCVSHPNTQNLLNDNFRVLPNVLIDLTNEIEPTCAIVSDNQNSIISFTDLSNTRKAMLSPRNIGNLKASRENITSKTILGDDVSFEQTGADGRIRSRSASTCSNTSLLDLNESIT